jgi:hypothetical protein
MILSLSKVATKTMLVTLMASISIAAAAEVLTCQKDDDCKAVSAYDIC